MEFARFREEFEDFIDDVRRGIGCGWDGEEESMVVCWRGDADGVGGREDGVCDGSGMGLKGD